MDLAERWRDQTRLSRRRWLALHQSQRSLRALRVSRKRRASGPPQEQAVAPSLDWQVVRHGPQALPEP